MFVVGKNRILLVLCSIVLSVFVVAVSVNEVRDSVMTSASPVSSRVVVLDAGHGIPDERG